MTDDEREKLIRDAALVIILEESKKWVLRFKLTMVASIVVALGFISYGVYLWFEISRGGSPALAVMALAITLGVAGSAKLGKRALKNLRSLLEVLEKLKKGDLFAK